MTPPLTDEEIIVKWHELDNRPTYHQRYLDNPEGYGCRNLNILDFYRWAVSTVHKNKRKGVVINKEYYPPEFEDQND